MLSYWVTPDHELWITSSLQLQNVDLSTRSLQVEKVPQQGPDQEDEETHWSAMKIFTICLHFANIVMINEILA